MSCYTLRAFSNGAVTLLHIGLVAVGHVGLDVIPLVEPRHRSTPPYWCRFLKAVCIELSDLQTKRAFLSFISPCGRPARAAGVAAGLGLDYLGMIFWMKARECGCPSRRLTATMTQLSVQSGSDPSYCASRTTEARSQRCTINFYYNVNYRAVSTFEKSIDGPSISNLVGYLRLDH